ncbi:MAG: rhodanese-like domain-containing protein [Bacteroidales bacterium]|nr:rhodanese-like domain-containing protein [Bacteroidales bacterium]
MKKLSIYFIALFIIPAFVLTSCKDKAPIDTPDPAFTVLTDYLSANAMDLTDIMGQSGTSTFFATKPPAEADLTAFLAKYTILDIRKADDFATGHISGAKNIVFSDIITEGNAASKQILVVCYTGQTACYATALLRLAGQSDTQALKWGMSGWHTDFAFKWDGGIGNIADGKLVTTATASLTFSDPELSETLTDGAALLDARIAAVVTDEFKGVGAGDVLDNPGNYFINNYFSEADYTAFGHIDGAYRINPLTLAGKEYNNLDPDTNGKVVTYCYTGQTSAVITAYLNVLGYDAYSLKFGMNGLWNLNPAWTSNQWSSTVPADLPYVTK